ncbi:MAG: tRNA (N(6)-L-threonylcarbamoyladenosine(37)-C(2))-methylthiotransferase MtaB [Gorillibacterium sp.]|nr:tRNA (N(6)-L-threonylcarbamoyladenosine(37)-C(2))-methylthiotransferase MtaB [Gorillibacterium sp.]
MSTVAFQTLGCKVNFYESEGIWQLFKQEGYEQVDFEASADVYVINTCTVTNTGDRKSRQVIRRAVRRNPDAIVCVTGCYAQTAPAEVAAIPGVDIVVGTQDRHRLLPLVRQFQEQREPLNIVRNIMKTRDFEEMNVPGFSDRTRGFLKIQEGCNNFCTFCIIPWSRGLLRSRKPENVLQQARQLVEAGYEEIVLTGIHTGGYGEDLEQYRLASLLEDLDRIAGIRRIRISSIEASQIDDGVLNVLKNSDKLCRHFHVPLQAGTDNVLMRMKRKYTTAEYGEKIARIHDIFPDVAITTDVIVGFPGETADMFEQGYRFMEKMQFSEMHVFPYSKRTGTPAAVMEDQVDDEIKDERTHRLIKLSETMQLAYAEKFVGQTLEIIPERICKEEQHLGMIAGYSDNYLQVAFPGSKDMLRRLIKVNITKPGVSVSEGNVMHSSEANVVASL